MREKARPCAMAVPGSIAGRLSPGGRDALPPRGPAATLFRRRLAASINRRTEIMRRSDDAPLTFPCARPVGGDASHGARRTSRGVRFLELSDDLCAFIAEDPQAVAIEDLVCCGAPVLATGSILGDRYCARHRAIVLVPRRPARQA
jgi:hypothetical protein